ncbi:MAG TPA: type I restriction endonuclease [Rubricoccaceae bacterium]|jgi:hypothetical protein
MLLTDRIRAARQRLLDGSLGNEASVSNGVVLPIIDALGWSAFDPAQVYPEYRVEGRRVDFALLTRGTPAVFIEVKQPGMMGRADRQLFEYAFHEGVPFAVLTDGGTWHFYVPSLQGSYDDRRVYLLDLLEREPDESAERLTRYLAREAVESGAAEERARSDHKRSRQRKGAEAAIPQAWANLVAEPRLADLLAAEVESACGFQPDTTDVAAFLASLHPKDRSLPAPQNKATSQINVPAIEQAESKPLFTPSDSGLSRRGFTLNGQFYPGEKGREVLAGVFKALQERDPSFFDRFISLPSHGRVRRYLSHSPEELYPGHPEIITGNVTEVGPSVFLGTHYSYRSMFSIVTLAAEVAGVELGKDLIVNFG